MPFSFGGPDFPVSLKVTRSLLSTQAVILGIGGLFFGIIAVTNIGSVSLLSAELTGGGLMVVAGAFVVAAFAVVALAVQLGRLQSWTRPAIVILEVILLIFFLARSTSNWTNIILILALAVGILATLFSKSASEAFAQAAGTAPAITPGSSSDSWNPALVVDPPAPLSPSAATPDAPAPLDPAKTAIDVTPAASTEASTPSDSSPPADSGPSGDSD